MLSYYENQEKTFLDAANQAAQIMKDLGSPFEGMPLDSDAKEIDKLFNQIKISASSTAEAIGQLKTSMNAIGDGQEEESIKQFIASLETAKSKMAEFSTTYGNAFETEQASAIDLTTKKIDELLVRLQALNEEGKSIDLNEILSENDHEIFKNLLDYTASSKNALDTVKKKGETVFKALGTTSRQKFQEMENNSKEAVNSMMRDLDLFFNKLKDSKEIRDFVTGLSGIGELASAFLMLSNIDNI
jgi:hypothetical protein